MKLILPFLAAGITVAPVASFAQDALVSEAPSVVSRASDRESRPGPTEHFTGIVTIESVSAPEGPEGVVLGIVSFEPNARSNWHSHPAGQNLFVTRGCGWTQAEGGPVERICEGDAVRVQPGVRHWHGATDTTHMTHLAITGRTGGSNVEWGEAVSDGQYLAGLDGQ